MSFMNNAYVVMLDIDGTIKDLVKENTDALVKTMKAMNRVDLEARGKFVLWINKINMYFIKTGLLPTNKTMQSILIFAYSILLAKRYKEFKSIYFENYNNEDIFFEGIDKKINELNARGKKLYLVTKNTQNRNILKYSKLDRISKLIIGKEKKIKYYTYKALIQENNLDKEKVTIIGDNFWDDILSALLLGVNVVWCNMYNCKLKNIAIKILCTINKRISSCDNVKNI